MLLAEYDYDTDIAVRCEEAGRIAFAEGIEKGIEQGIQRGIEQGFFDGSYQAKVETARNLLGLGLSIENIAQATGLSAEDLLTLEDNSEHKHTVPAGTREKADRTSAKG